MMIRGVRYSKSAAKRIAVATRFVEQQPRSQVAPAAGPVDFAGITMILLTVACSPISGATPSQNGRGKIQSLVSGSYVDLASTVYPIVNDIANTIAIGAYCQCLPGAGGMFHVINVDKCSNLS
jgi:hypothetical protein